MGVSEEHRRAAMSTPTVIEITRRPESVVHDPFIDDLRLPIQPDVPSDACVTNRISRQAVTLVRAGCFSSVRMPPSNR
jgi:hypothetical protein